MRRIQSVTATALLGALAFALGMPVALAQGKIICWKDASGKTLGCGDKVPAEYAGGATRELDKQGNVRKTGESAEELAKRQASEKEQASAKAAEARRLTDKNRQDAALIHTFGSEKEIDLKRDRELLALSNFLVQQHAALKGTNERLADARKRVADLQKDKKPVPPATVEDLARAEREHQRVTGDIAANEKAKTDTTLKYAEYRKRYSELKGSGPEASAAAPAAKK